MTERFVVLGLAGARSAWFGQVARWASEAILPIDFIKCLTVDELAARLHSGRAHSAAILDAGVRAIDRDLVALATDSGCAVFLVDDRPTPTWQELGATAVLGRNFTRDELLDALHRQASPVRVVTGSDAHDELDLPKPQAWRGRLVTVTGAPGAGTTTVAAALAQGMANDARHGALVALADLARRADQAMVHDIDDVVPSLSELVEAHRNGATDNEATRNHLFTIADRRYDLLIGLRRSSDWTGLRPRATAAALESLRRAYRVVIADTECDVEGLAQCGSSDVEDRHLLSRTAIGGADVVLVVGQPSLWGMHGLVRAMHDIAAAGFDTDRVMPVINQAPRSRRARAGLTEALADLLGDARPGFSPLFVERKARIERVADGGGRLPDAMGRTLANAVAGGLDRVDGPTPTTTSSPVAIQPGELGSWTDLDDSGSDAA